MTAPDKKTAIHFAQMRQLFAASKVSLISSMILAAILAYALREVVDVAVLIGWFSLIVISSLSRAALMLFYQRSTANSEMHDWLV